MGRSNWNICLSKMEYTDISQREVAGVVKGFCPAVSGLVVAAAAAVVADYDGLDDDDDKGRQPQPLFHVESPSCKSIILSNSTLTHQHIRHFEYSIMRHLQICSFTRSCGPD